MHKRSPLKRESRTFDRRMAGTRDLKGKEQKLGVSDARANQSAPRGMVGGKAEQSGIAAHRATPFVRAGFAEKLPTTRML